jgi:C-terminal processing protease CtpA/Prc
MTADGEKLYYLSSVEKGYDLWRIDLRKGDISVVNKLDACSAPRMQMVGDNLFLLSGSMMNKMAVSGEKISNISYSARMALDHAAERDYMLEYVRDMERTNFYTVDMHGVKWDALVDHYRKFLPHISNNYDFSEMLSELLGELNVSHTGSGYRPGQSAEESTADLGLLFDMNFTGIGMKVAEVVKGGPLDKAGDPVKPGDIIMAVNGTEVTADITSLLNGVVGKSTLLKVRNSAGADTEVVVKPISRGAMSDLLYRRWVRRNAATVDSLSNGRLGYVHIESMADPSFREIYADVLGKYNDREGIVIDTRFNGGGRMHEDIEVLFSGEKYLTQVVRGNATCDMPSRRWNKPSIMLICEANYSNAHGTPWVYSHRGLGKLVGSPVPGTMTSVNWVTLQDPTMYFGIPVIGYQLPDGSYLENAQLEPDVKVFNTPEHLAAGIDDQLRAAVATLLTDLDSK